MLGDSCLDPTENLVKLKEGNQKLIDRQKMAKQSELEDPERMLGPKMPYQELIRKLQKLNLNIKVRDGAPGQLAFYVLKNRKEMEETAAEDMADNRRSHWFTAHKYVTGCPKEPLPEYSGVTTDERGIAKRELRGWRSILIALIKNRAVTVEQCCEEFGDAVGRRSWRWHEQLQGFKKK